MKLVARGSHAPGVCGHPEVAQVLEIHLVPIRNFFRAVKQEYSTFIVFVKN
jgi:hypothetical protein